MPDTQPSASALSDNAILNIAYKRTWLRAVSFKSDEIIDFVRAIEEAIAALPAPVSEPIVGWLIDDPEEPEIGHWYAEERDPICRSRALCFATPPQAVVAQPVDGYKLGWIDCEGGNWRTENITTSGLPKGYYEVYARLSQSPQAKAGDKHD